LGDVKDEKIIDIGAGTGYFSFRLAEAGATVIAADVDERFLEYIKEKKAKLNMTDGQIIVRKVPYNSPNLGYSEVDKAIIVNTYHHIEDRSEYFAKVKKGLKPDGELIVIDFFKKKTPVGPPVKMKMLIKNYCHINTLLQQNDRSVVLPAHVALNGILQKERAGSVVLRI